MSGAGLLAAAGVLLGGGGVVAFFRVRPANRKTNADAALTMQQATSAAIENIRRAAAESVREAEDRASHARAEAAFAQASAGVAQDEMRQLRVELLQARTDMADLRAQCAAERREWAVERASAVSRASEDQAAIVGLQRQLAGVGSARPSWNGAAGL